MVQANVFYASMWVHPGEALGEAWWWFLYAFLIILPPTFIQERKQIAPPPPHTPRWAAWAGAASRYFAATPNQTPLHRPCVYEYSESSFAHAKLMHCHGYIHVHVCHEQSWNNYLTFLAQKKYIDISLHLGKYILTTRWFTSQCSQLVNESFSELLYKLHELVLIAMVEASCMTEGLFRNNYFLLMEMYYFLISPDFLLIVYAYIFFALRSAMYILLMVIPLTPFWSFLPQLLYSGTKTNAPPPPPPTPRWATRAWGGIEVFRRYP